jgi:hypothetical protein
MNELTPIELADLNQRIGYRRFFNMPELDIYGGEINLSSKGTINSVNKEMTEEEQLMEELIQNQSKFTTAVEKIRKDFDISYIDSIIHYCTENEIELNIVDSLVTPNLKEKLEAEAVELNFLPRGGVLPI